MTTEQIEAQNKLAALQAELASIDRFLEEAEQKRKRRGQLVGNYCNRGEIHEAELAVRDARFPIFQRSRNNWDSNLRIIGVTEKVIRFRYDGEDEDKVRWYSRANGKKSGRSDYDKIDVERALKIWEEHQQAKRATDQPTVRLNTESEP